MAVTVRLWRRASSDAIGGEQRHDVVYPCDYSDLMDSWLKNICATALFLMRIRRTCLGKPLVMINF